MRRLAGKIIRYHDFDRFKMISFFIAVTALLALLATLTLAHDLEHIAISGWWSECDLDDGASLAESCAGNYVENAEPAALDLTGNTCYVNPLQTSTTSAGVFWFGPLVNNTGTYLYNLLLLGENVTMYKPANCSAMQWCLRLWAD